MKASVSPASFVVAVALALTLSATFAQDAVLTKDGTRREGQVLGVRGDAIRFKVGPAETSIPLATVTLIDMAPPKAYNDALAAWKKNDTAGTITLLKPLVDNFQGLQTEWATRASSLLGDAYVESNNLPEAEKAYAAFQKAYPNNASSADVGVARIAVANKDYDTARSKLAPVVDTARKTLMPDSENSPVLGQALYLMGQVEEASGNNSEALQNYLLAATIFREDETLVAKAEQRAGALREKNVVVP